MPKILGPKDGDIITATFSGTLNNRLKSRVSSLANAKDLVLLSIQGNEGCSGDYLGAMVAHAVATHKTKGEDTPAVTGKTTFLIADELYWHNLKQLPPAKNDEEELKAKALEMGDSFFKQNRQQFLTPLGITAEAFDEMHGKKTIDEQISAINAISHAQSANIEIMRWNTWVNQNNAAEKIGQMLPLFETEAGLSSHLELDVADFVKRHSKLPEDMDLWSYRSKAYLTEECPAVMWLSASLGYNFIIYPGKIPSSFTVTREFFIVKNHQATVKDGKSVEDSCTHNPLSLHVPNPNTLANWLEVSFTRSYAPASKYKGTFFSQSSSSSTLLRTDELSDETLLSSNTGATSSSKSDSPGIEMFSIPNKVDLALSSSGQKNTVTSKDLASSVEMQALVDGVIVTMKENTEATLPSASEKKLIRLFQSFTTELLNASFPLEKKLTLLQQVSQVIVSHHSDVDPESIAYSIYK